MGGTIPLPQRQKKVAAALWHTHIHTHCDPPISHQWGHNKWWELWSTCINTSGEPAGTMTRTFTTIDKCTTNKHLLGCKITTHLLLQKTVVWDQLHMDWNVRINHINYKSLQCSSYLQNSSDNVLSEPVFIPQDSSPCFYSTVHPNDLLHVVLIDFDFCHHGNLGLHWEYLYTVYLPNLLPW